MDIKKVLEALVNVLGSGRVSRRAVPPCAPSQDFLWQSLYQGEHSLCGDPGVGFHSESVAHRFNVTKKFQSVEESGPGGQLGDWLPRKVSEEAGRRWRAEGQVLRADMTEVNWWGQRGHCKAIWLWPRWPLEWEITMCIKFMR